MLNRNTILNELKELAPGLVSMPQENPYQVPTGYFDKLPERMLELVKIEGSPVLQNNKENPYQVPTGYFENLSDIILNKVRAIESGSPKEELEVLSPLLSGLSKKAPFSIPQGYFEELPSNITDGAKAIDLVNEELENLSPLMNGLKGVNVYEVPARYFEQLPELVLQKAKQQQPAKLVSMTFTRKVMQYAVAAAMTGLIIMGALKLINNPATPSDINIASIPETEIIQYLESNGDNTEPVLTTTTDEESIDLSADDMKEMLADISDEELQQFVEQAGGNNSITN
jgi:hypothetical protein